MEKTRSTQLSNVETKQPRTLESFLHANADRVDRWNRRNTVATRLSLAQQAGLYRAPLDAAARGIFEDIEPLEHYWAFPGKTLFTSPRSDLTTGDSSQFAHRVNRIARALKSASYRRNPGAWKLLDEQEKEGEIAIDYYEQRDLAHPYFEVMLVRDNPLYENEERMRDEIRRPLDTRSLWNRAGPMHPSGARLCHPIDPQVAFCAASELEDYDDQEASGKAVLDAWDKDEFVLDSARMTLM